MRTSPPISLNIETLVSRHLPFLLVAALLFPGSSLGEDKASKQKGEGQWKNLFDGKSLKGWEVVKGDFFEGHGPVEIKDGCLVIGTGQPATGVRSKHPLPKGDYEISLEARRVEGNDFFCGMSFPAGGGALTLILGGWSGSVCGLSCIDNYLAVDNETCQVIDFKKGRWYRIRVRVTKPKVQIWVDDKQIIDLDTKDRKFTVSMEMEPCQPFGFATWYTTGSLRKIRYRAVR